MAETYETKYYQNGICCKVISLTVMARDFVVEEKEAIRDLGPIVKTEWRQVFFQNLPNFEYAQTIYLGRVTKAATNNGNSNQEDFEREQRERMMYGSVGRAA